MRAALTSRSKAIVSVHLAGWPCDMDPILELAEQHGLYVIEDCAQAHGASYKGRPVGSMGHAAAFSFCQDKIISTGGEGGLLATNDPELWRKAWEFKDHGKSYGAMYSAEHGAGFRWLHHSFGTNWRMTEIQSAIGRIALRKLAGWVDCRRRNADILNSYLAGVECIRRTIPEDHFFHSYYKFYCFARPDKLRPDWSRDRLIEEISAAGVPCFSGSCSEIYLERAFPSQWRPETRLLRARELGETSLMFLVHPTLTMEQMHDMGSAVRQVAERASI
ncbi:MAG: DegT/DnrJ/EryC1/StrS aminotransferase family protein [Acidobacteriaceae bacterium]